MDLKLARVILRLTILEWLCVIIYIVLNPLFSSCKEYVRNVFILIHMYVSVCIFYAAYAYSKCGFNLKVVWLASPPFVNICTLTSIFGVKVGLLCRLQERGMVLLPFQLLCFLLQRYILKMLNRFVMYWFLICFSATWYLHRLVFKCLLQEVLEVFIAMVKTVKKFLVATFLLSMCII